ncbi:MAG: hypothetical protein Greene041662_965 [Candidatus Peregrinibacteria bacterium Greene0416_62]|nr:MAG: hypothetical protein Greene041662_965 [Candidatus Peregrinibacteria bacterium Greene0416_62]TSD00110.1 MAG: hypothetical protein Greene101449_323 [Candidatus Peregrinibacteria bacterium Greene1014_49]
MSTNQIDDYADVIEAMATSEGRNVQDLQAEVPGLAAYYRHVMGVSLMPLVNGYTTQDRVNAITAMRHYMQEGEREEEFEQAAA